jgi:quinol-cytochrome oxidoreductase complex cytochrome b subunit
MSVGERIRKALDEHVYESALWKSIFRHEFPDDERNRFLVVASNVFLHLHPAEVRGHGLRMRYTWCMGGLAFLLFLILTASGALLMLYYRPTPERAYMDMVALREDVSLGTLMRNLHRWAGHAMVVVVGLHMLRVFLTGSYKNPREFNWVIGVVLLVLALALSFTGYMLPWDQTAVGAVMVGSNMAAAAPFVGSQGPGAMVSAQSDVRALLLGGTTIGATALVRFYVLHCVLLPLAAAVMMGVHFWRVRKDGFSAPL